MCTVTASQSQKAAGGHSSCFASAIRLKLTELVLQKRGRGEHQGQAASHARRGRGLSRHATRHPHHPTTTHTAAHRSMNALATAATSGSRLSLVVGPWLMGPARRPSSSHSWPPCSTNAMKCRSTSCSGGGGAVLPRWPAAWCSKRARGRGGAGRRGVVTTNTPHMHAETHAPPHTHSSSQHDCARRTWCASSMSGASLGGDSR